MKPVRQIVGAALILIGIVVAVHTVVEPLYHASSQASPTARPGVTSTR